MAQLNELQQRVVNTLDRNLLVLASAGTGKTNTLAHRVAHIITSGRASAEAILCMTFTNKASREMKDRIATIAGWVRLAELTDQGGAGRSRCRRRRTSPAT